MLLDRSSQPLVVYDPQKYILVTQMLVATLVYKEETHLKYFFINEWIVKICDLEGKDVNGEGDDTSF